MYISNCIIKYSANDSTILITKNQKNLGRRVIIVNDDKKEICMFLKIGWIAIKKKMYENILFLVHRLILRCYLLRDCTGAKSFLTLGINNLSFYVHRKFAISSFTDLQWHLGSFHMRISCLFLPMRPQWGMLPLQRWSLTRSSHLSSIIA